MYVKLGRIAQVVKGRTKCKDTWFSVLALILTCPVTLRLILLPLKSNSKISIDLKGTRGPEPQEASTITVFAPQFEFSPGVLEAWGGSDGVVVLSPLALGWLGS